MLHHCAVPACCDILYCLFFTDYLGLLQVCVCAYRDARQLRQAQEVRVKNIISTYNQAHRYFPKVRLGQELT